jgi:hypothetical protein
MPEVDGPVQHTSDLVRAENARQRGASLRMRKAVIEPLDLEGTYIEKAQSGSVEDNGVYRSLPLRIKYSKYSRT